MESFTLSQPKTPALAILEADKEGVKFIAGGTNLIDLMKHQIEKPLHLVDVNNLDLKEIRISPGGGIFVGALVSNSHLAHHPLLKKQYAVLSEAILSGASPQLRNMATVGGNLLQRTRCSYFYDPVFPCNKRNPGSGCSALSGFSRNHAILGVSDQCIATHPSDMCVAMVALGASVNVRGPEGERTILLNDLHALPQNSPQTENSLRRGELILSVELPPLGESVRSCYLKVRDRSSYEFALASAAVALDVQKGIIKEARIALGGVGTKPWRTPEAEHILVGEKPDEAIIKKAADAALEHAKTTAHNKFKVELAKRTLVQAVNHLKEPAWTK